MKYLIAVISLIFSTACYAQGSVNQSGSVATGHVPRWNSNRTIMDAGPSTGGNANVGITDLPIVNTGKPLCIYDAPITNALGYHSLCFGANDTGDGGIISYSASGGASPLSLKCNINGTVYDCVNTGNGNIVGPSPTTVGNIVLFNNTTGTLVSDSGLRSTQLGLHLATNAALVAAATTAYTTGVWRDDYTVGGGANPLFFLPSTAACTIPGGDGGTQVPSADGKCWIAQHTETSFDPQQFGCKGDNTTNDTTCFQAAVTAAANRSISIGQHIYCVSGITIANPMKIEGSGIGIGTGDSNSGIKACAANTNLITITGNGVTLSKLILNGLGGNTAGYAIRITGHSNFVEGVQLNGFCNYLINVGRHNIITGNTFTDNVNPSVSTGCYVITDGDSTAQTIGSVYTNNILTTWGPSAGGTYTAGMLFQNSGGPFISQNDIQRTNYGTIIKPLADKTTSFMLFDNTVLGDTTNADGLLIDTSNANSKVEIIKINNSYFGRNGDWPGTFTWQLARNVTIQNTGLGTVTGIHFNGVQMNTASDENIAIAGNNTVNDITIDNSTLCFPGQKNDGSANIALVNTSTFAIRNNTIGSACDSTSFTPLAVANILFGTNNSDNGTITGNQFYGPWTLGNGPITGDVTNTANLIIKDNLYYENNILSLASAAAVEPLFYPLISLTGVTAVTNIHHPWTSREINLFVADGLTFTAGGGGPDPICKNAAVAAGDLVTAKFWPGSNCWLIH